MNVHYNNVHSFSLSLLFLLVLVSSANTTTTVQPAIRPTNNTRQPTVAQRRHHSPPSAVITSTAYKETRLSTSTAMLSTMEPTRYVSAQTIALATREVVELFPSRLTHKPQPKPRLSLAKTIAPRDADRIIPTTGNGGVVQRIKPFFEPPSLSLSEEPKPIRPLQQQQQQQQRPPITIPYTYQAVKVPKATCLDDIIPSKVEASRIEEDDVTTDVCLLENLHHITSTAGSSTTTSRRNLHRRPR